MFSSRKIQLKSKVVTQEKIAISRYVLIKDPFLGFQFEVFENQCSNFHLFVDKIWQIFEVISWKKILSKSLDYLRYLSLFLNDLMKKIRKINIIFEVFLVLVMKVKQKRIWVADIFKITVTFSPCWIVSITDRVLTVATQWLASFVLNPSQ